MADATALTSLAPVIGSAAGPVGTAVGLGISALPELFKTINGISQVSKANKINPIRPTMAVPQAINEATDTARAQYYNPRLPQSDYIAGRIGASAAGAVRAAQDAGKSPAEILAAAAGAEDQQNDALTNLAMEGARNQSQNANLLTRQLDYNGEWQDKADAYNQRQPYADQVAAKSDLTKAGNLNIENGLQGIASVGAHALTGATNPHLARIQGMAPTSVGPTMSNPTDPDNSGYGNLSPSTLYKIMNSLK